MKRSAGFSLIEVIVAFAIAGVALALLAQIFGGAARNVADAEAYGRAVVLAESVLDEAAIAVPPLEDGGDSGEFSWTVEYSPYEPPLEDATDIPVESPSRHRLENIVVSVNWRAGARRRQVTLERLAFRAPP